LSPSNFASFSIGMSPIYYIVEKAMKKRSKQDEALRKGMPKTVSRPEPVLPKFALELQAESLGKF
jgi:hypothetical protein